MTLNYLASIWQSKVQNSWLKPAKLTENVEILVKILSHKTVSLSTVGLSTASLSTVGLSTVGLSTASLSTASLSTVGLSTWFQWNSSKLVVQWKTFLFRQKVSQHAQNNYHYEIVNRNTLCTDVWHVERLQHWFEFHDPVLDFFQRHFFLWQQTAQHYTEAADQSRELKGLKMN